MFRIDDPSASPTLPTPEAAGTEGFWTEGNPAGGVPATLERASWFNMVQEELRAIVVAGGLTPSKTTYNQVLTAIKAVAQSNQASYAADVGTTNALVASLSPAPAALSSGMSIRIHVAANNTGASTLNLNGLGALPINGLAGAALQGGELKAGVVASFILSDDKSTWILTGCEFGAAQLGASSYLETIPSAADNSKKLISSSWIYSAMATIATAMGFAASFSTNGYVKFPSWLGSWILQWGQVTCSTSGPTTANFPLTWPVSAYMFVTSPMSPTAGGKPGASVLSTSQFNIASTNIGGTVFYGDSVGWISVGK